MATPYSTAADLINRAAVQCGLDRVTDPYASQDGNFIQLCEFLSVVGEDLLNEADWTHLRREALIATVAGQAVYPLPADVSNLVDGTTQNRSTFLPPVGPISGQLAQALKARLVGQTVSVLYRQRPGEIELLGSVPDGQTLALEYTSDLWVRDAASLAVDSAGVPVGTKSDPTQGGDLILFPPLLIVRALKVQWAQLKGFDTTTALAEYQKTMEAELGANLGGPTLSLSRRSDLRLIDASNAPDTGYGS